MHLLHFYVIFLAFLVEIYVIRKLAHFILDKKKENFLNLSEFKSCTHVRYEFLSPINTLMNNLFVI